VATSSQQGDLFGHPRGLTYLFTTEMWERFSYYGMRALLVLYMVKYAFQPERAQEIIGFATLKAGLEALFGPLGVQPLSSQVYGLYTGLVYFTPILGGILADRWLGQRKTVVVGAALMAVGHFMMAFEPLFLLALTVLILGNGAFKPNISTAPSRSFMSASISARFSRRSSAARSAKSSAGTTASARPASA
jgi:POT family proton-dependent oligopeptide transporter